MRSFRVFLVTLALAIGAAFFSPASANAVVCHDYPGGCCGEVELLGKTILRIDC